MSSSYGAERALACLYPLLAGCTVLCCITSGVLWSHWQYVLNACPESNCGCFLHARTTYTSFEGGHIAYCHYATYGLILPLIFAAILAIYHIYRVCLGVAKPRSGTTTIRQKSGDVVVVTTESELNRNDVSPYYWLPCSLISGILTIYTLVYASIYTSGFESTCKQYREALLKEIQGVGNIVPVIKGRLSCSAIFDFMDYLVESIRYERRRYGRINSAICFYFTLIFSWLAVIALLLITVINIVQMRRTRPVRI